MFRLKISDPCGVPWESMRRVGPGRYCDTCAQPVHDLTRATELEARAVAALFGNARLCGRARFDADGNAVFRAEERRAPRSAGGKRMLATAAMTLAPLSAACAARPAPPAEVVTPSASCGTHVRLDTPPAPAPATANAPPPKQDTDGDGIADDDDACPTVAGVAPDGCPSRPRVVIEESGGMPIIQYVHFRSARSTIEPAALPLLDEVAKLVHAHPEITQIEVEGHADATEKDPARVSLARADETVRYLSSKGVPAGLLVAKGAGNAKPIAPNATPDDRARNRRVEFHVVSP